MKRQNPQVPGPFRNRPCLGVLPENAQYFGELYLSTASLNAFAARNRTTVLALILMASPVAGLRPIRALRCALTARPRPGITNLPAPLDSFTASLNSSSKNYATCFFDTGFSGVLTFSARCATIFDLLIGPAIHFLLARECLWACLRQAVLPTADKLRNSGCREAL